MSSSGPSLDGQDLGPGVDLRDLIRRRMRGEVWVPEDAQWPHLHVWLGRAYDRLVEHGQGERMGAAAAELVDHAELSLRQAAAYLLGRHPRDPRVAPAIRKLLSGDRSRFAGLPGAFGNEPGGLEGVLIAGLGDSMVQAEAESLAVLRGAAMRPGLAVPTLAALAEFDPGFLVRAAADIARGSGVDAVATLLAFVDPTRGRPRARRIAPACDVVARIARAAAMTPDGLDAGIQSGGCEAHVQRALFGVARQPGPLGDYDAEALRDGATADEARQRCLRLRGCWGATLDALLPEDPGFVQRSLASILRATPGAVAPTLAFLAARRVDPRELARRVAAVGAVDRGAFVAACACAFPRDAAEAAAAAWPASGN